MKRALVTGITGQDGHYLAELLRSYGYQVFGMVRRTSHNCVASPANVTIVSGDMLDKNSLTHVLEESKPDEIYNLAAQSFVGASWDQATLTTEVNGLGVLRLLEAARQVCPGAKIYQASTSEMFGNEPAPQNERTPFRPRSPYGSAKLYGHNIAVNFRESYGMYIACGILFNHESPKRGTEFVTRKITQAVARIAAGECSTLSLGDLHAKRDWGYAGDYVQAMWLMLQQNKPDDFVIGTGETHSVEEFAELAFTHAGLDWRKHVVTDPQFYRPADVNLLMADTRKAAYILNWRPAHNFKQLVNMMVDHDLLEHTKRI